MRNKLDFVKRDITEWTRKIDAAMAARAAAITAANAELDAKITLAKAQLAARHIDYLTASRSISRHIKLPFSFFENPRQRFQMSKLQYETAQMVVKKLEIAKELIANLQRDDLVRQAELTEQNNKINPLWDALDAKLTRGEDWDNTDKDNYKKIETAKAYINDSCERVAQNTQRIEHLQQMAAAYDDTHPERFPSHWSEFASIIVEQRDIYGFHGEVYRRDLNELPKTPETGLEGYSTSYGAILKPGQMVRYTMPGTKILLEQDKEGRVHDKTPPSASQQHKVLAAIKTAHLLLLDRSLHPDKKIHLKGGAAQLPQVYLIVAALLVQAKQAGLVLKLEDVTVDVPGWTNWRSSTIQSRAAIKQNEATIEGALAHYRAQNELKDKIQHLRGKTIMVGEPAHPPRKH